MIDLHTHTLLSDGALLPSELARRYEVLGYKTIAITDHVDGSNIDFVVPRVVSICEKLNSVWKIKLIPGIELTHAPLEHFEELIKYARSQGIKLVVVHGETLAEPVISGTNEKALECDIDILAHPGLISFGDAQKAAKENIYLEVTTRALHDRANTHVIRMAKQTGAKLVLNSDVHQPKDLLPLRK